MRTIREGLILAALMTLAACGSSKSAPANLTAGPSVFDAPLGSDAVLLNGTGMNPDVLSNPAGAAVAGGCLVRFTNVDGNDINCSDSAQYASMSACQLNPYYGFANFLVEACPTANLIGSCNFGTHTMYYYQGYLIVSPGTPVSDLAAGCATDGGTWG